ncbi:hypothetical protein F4861DRAFT_102580 [Xylaria intraflava]|nr:hypothetical protein F4861DRAFT_102580 [Xylaria intraflava]
MYVLAEESFSLSFCRSLFLLSFRIRLHDKYVGACAMLSDILADTLQRMGGVAGSSAEGSRCLRFVTEQGSASNTTSPHQNPTIPPTVLSDVPCLDSRGRGWPIPFYHPVRQTDEQILTVPIRCYPESSFIGKGKTTFSAWAKYPGSVPEDQHALPLRLPLPYHVVGGEPVSLCCLIPQTFPSIPVSYRDHLYRGCFQVKSLHPKYALLLSISPSSYTHFMVS